MDTPLTSLRLQSLTQVPSYTPLGAQHLSHPLPLILLGSHLESECPPAVPNAVQAPKLHARPQSFRSETEGPRSRQRVRPDCCFWRLWGTQKPGAGCAKGSYHYLLLREKYQPWPHHHKPRMFIHLLIILVETNFLNFLIFHLLFSIYIKWNKLIFNLSDFLSTKFCLIVLPFY